MSDIVIEGKNLKDIDQSNFQSVGPYTDNNNTQVKEPWQGRDIVNGENQDKRFELGTYTENNRGFWESQTVNKLTRTSQIAKKNMKTARAYVDPNTKLVISDETGWSVDSFPYVKDQKTDEFVPLYFYYDKDLHPNEYNNAVNGKINFRIELREDGRGGDGIIDNFLLREPFRPFVFGFRINSYDTEADGEPSGDGAYDFGDYVTIQIEMNEDSYFENWTSDAITIPNSTFNPTSFIMPREDFELTANVRPNPIIKMVARTNGTVDESAANVSFWNSTTGNIPTTQITIANTMFWAKAINTLMGGDNESDIPDSGTSDLFTGEDRGFIDPYTGEGVFRLLSSTEDSYNSDDYYTVYDYTWGSNISDEFIASATGSQFQIPTITTTTLQSNVIRPMENIKMMSLRSGIAYEFENFTYIDNDDEYTISSSIIDKPFGLIGLGGEAENDETIPEATTEISPQPNFSAHDGVMQIYANYNVLLYQIRNYNAWKDQNVQSPSYRLKYGYGDVLVGPPDDLDNIFETEQLPLTSELQIVAKPGWSSQGQLGGYELGYFFYWNNLSGLTIQEFNDEILATQTSVTGGDSISINHEQDQNNDITTQLIRTANSEENSVNYVGHVFKPTGTYVKITKTDDSHDFYIGNPHDSNVIRSKENSTDIDADMYQIGGNLQWAFTPNMVHAQGEVGEMPVIQSINKWDDEGNEIITETDISAVLTNFNMTYVQDGESMRLTYNPPGSTDDIIYSKYFEFVVKSTIVPPPLEPFLGVFEINFNSNSENLGTVSFLQEADEVPQTTVIGLFGQDELIETPTHAINMDAWIAGATVGILPIPLDIDINSGDTELTFLTANLSPNFETRVDQILEDNVFDDYDAGLKSSIKEHLVNEYLNLQITDNNLFSIEPNTSNEAVREFLRVVEQNNNLPRLPLRVTGTFSQVFTLTLSPNPMINTDNSPPTTHPTKFITNWDQDAYNANSSLSAADTWLNDDLLEVNFADMLEDTLNIDIPATFFNGSRQIKIIQQIAPQSGADEGTDLFYAGASDPILYTNEISTFRYRHRIVNMDSSSTITLNWVGGF
jgi:hypothetical protein